MSKKLPSKVCLEELWTKRTLSTHLGAILDLDGVLCDNSHRTHFIPKPTASAQEAEWGWKDYQAGLVDDKLYKHVYHMYCYLSGKYPTARRIVLTGRTESCRYNTVVWLNKHNIQVDELYMRAENDFRPNAEIKLDMLSKLKNERIAPWFAFENNKATCQMMLAQKIYVYEVQHGIIVPCVVEKSRMV